MSILSISVMMHPSREKYKDYFLSELGDVGISMDDGCGLVKNALNAWSMYDNDAGYHLVLNDDAILCKNFRSRVENILRWDNRAYSLYFGIRPRTKAQIDDVYNKKKGYLLIYWLTFGVAIVLPTRLIPGMFDYFNTNECHEGLPPNRNSDTRIARYARSKKMLVYYPIPSLVDHREEDESLVFDRGKGRHAQYFIDKVQQ